MRLPLSAVASSLFPRHNHWTERSAASFSAAGGVALSLTSECFLLCIGRHVGRSVPYLCACEPSDAQVTREMAFVLEIKTTHFVFADPDVRV